MNEGLPAMNDGLPGYSRLFISWTLCSAGRRGTGQLTWTAGGSRLIHEPIDNSNLNITWFCNHGRPLAYDAPGLAPGCVMCYLAQGERVLRSGLVH